MDISHLNITGEVDRGKINGFIPLLAQFAAMNPKNTFIEKFYKIEDNTLFYWGERGGWFTSEFNKNGKDFKKLQTIKFLHIIN